MFSLIHEINTHCIK